MNLSQFIISPLFECVLLIVYSKGLDEGMATYKDFSNGLQSNDLGRCLLTDLTVSVLFCHIHIIGLKSVIR